MSEEQKPPPGPFDVDTIRQLIRLMRKFDLSEVSLQDGDRRVRLRRGGGGPAAYGIPAALLPPTAAPAPTPAPTAATTAAPPAAATTKLTEIKSPMVGTFYAKPAPEKDDYVKIGARVTAETVVCKIEAMKIFNDLPAGCAGTVAEICVQNGEFVEYDQVLFRVEPS